MASFFSVEKIAQRAQFADLAYFSTVYSDSNDQSFLSHMVKNMFTSDKEVKKSG